MEIMSARLSRPVTVYTFVCLLLGGAATAVIASDLVLQKVPALTVEQAPAYPENVARYHSGAGVEAIPQSHPLTNLQLSSKTEDANTAEGALLCSDPTVGYALSNGATTLIISLSKIENIDSVSLLNRGTKGSMTVAVSNAKLPVESSQWREVSRQELAPDAVKAKIGPSEAKYVKLTFKVSDPGRISALGIYSAPTMAAFTMPRAKKSHAKDHSESFALISYNLTDVHAKARALYVSSGDDLRQANNMIDDQPATTYSFASGDATPTAVIDLGKVTTLRRISAIYSPRAGNIDFFVLKSLPGIQSATARNSARGTNGKALATESAPKTLHLDAATLATMEQVGTVSDGSGRAAVDFPETSGRYIVLRCTPAAQQNTPFSVAEVAAFGGNNDGRLVAANTASAASEQVESDGKTVQEGKDLGGGKDIPAEGADVPAEGPPPGLPDPPPFTFVPLLVPTSP